MKKFIVLFLVLILCNCRKKDTVEPSVKGDDVYLYQLVTLDVTGVELTKSEYKATFGKSTIDIIKTDANTLGFVVSPDADLGNTTMVISELNITRHYNVLKPVMTQSADETIGRFIALGDSFWEKQPDIGPDNVYNQFKNYYANHATAEEKEGMAMFYSVNKQAIDQLILFDPENENVSGGRLGINETLTIGKFSITLFDAGRVVLLAGAATLLGVGPALVVAVVLFPTIYKKAADYLLQLQDLPMKTIDMIIEKLSEVNLRVASNRISLTDNVASAFSFRLLGRSLTSGDSNTSNQTVSGFFNSLNKINDFINKTNTAIEWINNNVPLAKFSKFGPLNLHTNPPMVNTDITADMMPDIKFSITDPNLQLVEASLQNSGQLRLQVKILNESVTKPYTSVLDYAYDDGYNNFSGQFSIEVNDEKEENDEEYPIMGSWTLTGVYKGGSFFPKGEVVPGAGDIFESGSMTISKNSIQINIKFGNICVWADPCGDTPHGERFATYSISYSGSSSEITSYSGNYEVSSQFATSIREESYYVKESDTTVEIPNGTITIRLINKDKIRVQMSLLLSSPASWGVYEGVFER